MPLCEALEIVREGAFVGDSLLIGLLLIIVGAGTVGILQASGLVRFPWQHHGIEPVPAGMVRLPTAARNIPAYTRVTDDDLIESGKQESGALPRCVKANVQSMPCASCPIFADE